MMEKNKNQIQRAKKLTNRSDGKLMLLDEKLLIQQVCMRPVLYDRSLKGYRKTSLRKQCWNNISKVLDSTEEECRKRWRSLRDSFAKHYKVFQRAGDTVANKQCKWVFYDQMSFLIPHIDGVSYDLDKILDELGDLSEDARSINSEPNVLNSTTEDLKQNDHGVKNAKEKRQDHQENLQNSSVSVQAKDFVPITIDDPQESPMNINDNNNGTTISTASCRHHNTCSNNTTSTNGMLCAETNGYNNGVFFDSDEKFLLSCATTLRRLTHRQNALARLKIQQILFNIEFDQNND